MIEKGVVPKATKLTPINPLPESQANPADAVRPRNTLSADEKKLFLRMAEVWAGLSEYTDVQIRRVVEYLEKSGQLELRLDANGDTLWQKKHDDVSANSIQTTGEGGFIVAGASSVSGIQGLSLLKLDAGGNVTWHKIYIPSEAPGSESATVDARSVHTTTDGGFIVAGGARGTGTSAEDAWVLTLDRAGNIVW